MARGGATALARSAAVKKIDDAFVCRLTSLLAPAMPLSVSGASAKRPSDTGGTNQ